MEVWLLMQISQMTTPLFTVALILLTGIIGASLAKQQGLQNIRKFQTGMAKGQPPTDVLLDGLLILIACVVLVTPGILTDIFGFALLTPPFRSVIKKALKKAFKKSAAVQFQSMSGFQTTQNETFTQSTTQEIPEQRPENENIIDVEFTSEPVDE